MSNPFPGMDPFLEDPAFWPDFHATFINYWREAIAEQLPGRYDARIGERVNLVEQPPETIRRVESDVAVSRRGDSGGTPDSAAGDAVATLEPVTIPLVMEEPARQTYIEILRRPDRELVAVLELLSPANKTPPGSGEYLAKRNAILRQDVHLLELDLLLQGERMPLRDPLPPADYYALLARADRRPDCNVYVDAAGPSPEDPRSLAGTGSGRRDRVGAGDAYHLRSRSLRQIGQLRSASPEHHILTPPRLDRPPGGDCLPQRRLEPT